MSVAVLLGDGPPELAHIASDNSVLTSQQVALVGLRSLDAPERQRVTASKIGAFTMRQIDEQGMAHIAAQVLEQFSGYDHIHVSLDLDSLDPTVAPGVGTPVPGGLSYREAHLLMEILADSGKVRSLDIVEVNPVLDEKNKTAQVAVELAASLFGQTIL
jgi:arginase